MTLQCSTGMVPRLGHTVWITHPIKIQPQKLILCMHPSINLCYKGHLSLFRDTPLKLLGVTIPSISRLDCVGGPRLHYGRTIDPKGECFAPFKERKNNDKGGTRDLQYGILDPHCPGISKLLKPSFSRPFSELLCVYRLVLYLFS